jgi:lipopolysaccharide export LptBFGC system permease protein LptF
LRITDEEHRIRLWFPLFLAWLILLPFVILALTFLGLAAVFMPARIRRMVFGIVKQIWIIICQLRQVHVATESKDKEVRIQFV